MKRQFSTETNSLSAHWVRAAARPAVWLMGHLKLPAKFLVLALLGALVLGILAMQVHQDQTRAIRTAEREVVGIRHLTEIMQTVQVLQRHRGYSSGYLAGDATLGPLLAATADDLEAKMRRIVETLRVEAPFSAAPQRIDLRWHQIRQDGLKWPAERNFADHSSLVNEFLDLSRQLGDTYGLSTDAKLDTHYLLKTAAADMPVLLEALAQVRGQGTQILASGRPSAAQTHRLIGYMAQAELALNNLRVSIRECARYNGKITHRLTSSDAEIHSSTLKLLAVIEQSVLGLTPGISPKDYFHLSTTLIDSGFAYLNELLLPTAREILEQRKNDAETAIRMELALLAVLIAVSGYLALGVYLATLDSIRRTSAAAEVFSQGHFSHRVTLDTRDELRQTGEAFNRMAEQLEELLALRTEAEQRQRAIIDSALDAVVQMDSEGLICGWSHHAVITFGWQADEVVGKPLHELIIPLHLREQHVRGLKKYLAVGAGSVLSRRIEIEALHRDGHVFPVELTISVLKTSKRVEFSAFLRDITQRRQSEEALRIAAIAFESDDGIAVTDAHGRVLRTNQAFQEITGYALDDIRGQTLLRMKSPRQDKGELREMRHALATQHTWQGELLGLRRNGEEFPQWARISAVKNDHGRVTHYVVSFTDITLRKQSEEAIFKLAFFDTLTGLPNRSLLLDRLKLAMANSQRSGRYCAALFLDLDNFKQLNDTRGHDAGDELLKQLATRLTESVRKGDAVCRLGGDEFVVLMQELSTDIEEAALQTEMITEKMLSIASLPFSISGGSYETGTSIGVALFKGNEQTIEEILKQADMAMYRAKEVGGHSVRFFDPGMQAAILERAHMESMLRDAIIHNQFLVHLQPQINHAGKVVGAEALVRWMHPTDGMISPARFIPLAETTGLILPIGFWVLDDVCRMLAQWSRTPALSKLSVAVNVSPKQFSLPNFVEQIQELVNYHQIDPRRLKLELTEGLLISNADETIEKMTALQANGITFSLDDFGTGYSSLSYLKRLPLNQLKIDQSFVREVLDDTNAAAIAKTIVALGKTLGMEVIAEGVETDGQRCFLEENGCVLYQGYLFSRPIARTDFEAFAQRTGAI